MAGGSVVALAGEGIRYIRDVSGIEVPVFLCRYTDRVGVIGRALLKDMVSHLFHRKWMVGYSHGGRDFNSSKQQN